ncbi:MAG: peptide deformylase [Chloroflexi bacterium]|jgi:peptide deformylase|nr:peptide deformylase [Chloroflexota bacterium]MBT3669289.1 peptide deformylase [Chloroflexota bacterium]MBT4003114.1 peptide deformylase [Chloroflexota bacterium]MBT4305996.1 peptide deformylase [Chloroflexota bacterium]MBT4532640.1 peptide deformylase [Chloroflexota bacterium]
MSLREIITIPNEVLKKKAKKVTDFGKDFQTLIDDMIETMRDAPGVGLAAPQVNILQRLIVVEYGDEEDETVDPKLFVMINPEITRESEDNLIGMEGCLSIPNYFGDVERAYAVTVKAKNRHGKNMKVKAKGWLARIIQHEIDHLNGVLFIDKALKIYSKEEIEAMAENDEVEIEEE